MVVVVVVVAVALLPLLVLMLILMDRIEDHLLRPARTPHRHTPRRPHLRLIPGGRRTSGAAAAALAETAEGARAA